MFPYRKRVLRDSKYNEQRKKKHQKYPNTVSNQIVIGQVLKIGKY
jgi:hypothetical protein